MLVKMKERFLTWLKNAAVMIIASLMLLGVIPLGMISLSAVNAEGDFLRLQPEIQLSLTADSDARNKEILSGAEKLYGVGTDRYGYLQFDLRELLDEKKENIKDTKLRLTFLKTPVDGRMPVRLWLMPNNNWSRSMKWRDRPEKTGEILVKTVNLAPGRDGEPRLFEVDLTDYLKKWIEEERETVSFRLDSFVDGVTGFFAGTDYEDPTFRPGLKVVTGEAADPDEKNLKKITLKEKYATSQRENTVAVVGGKEEIFLKFSLNPNNIQGAVYQAHLNLQCLSKSPDASLQIERLTNTKWTEETLKDGEKPKGERQLVYREEDDEAGNYEGINLTEVFMDACAKGETQVTLVLGSKHGEIAFGFDGKTKPSMELLVSDHRDALALEETVAKLLGENEDRNGIVQSFSDDRIAENGVRTGVTWKAVDRKKVGKPAGDTLAANGRIHQPKWFQESRDIVAKATVSAGRYKAELIYYLSVLPQEEPELGDVEFGTMLDIGNNEKEKEQRAESTGTIARSRWVDGTKLTYREIGAEGMVALHLGVDPKNQNYLTVKLWEEDEFSGIRITDLQNRKQKAFELHDTEMAVKEESGFCYLTYPIPLAYTKDKNYVSLRLTMVETEDAVEGSENQPTISVYSAYITQTPYFDPMTFADQGEPIIKKEEESSIYQFLRKIYGAAESTFDFRDTQNPEASVSQEGESGVYTDVENREQTALVFGKEEQLMLELPEKGKVAKVYRDTSYYNAYAEMQGKEYDDGKLQTVDYGIFRIFRNRGSEELEIPWKEENLSGLYRNLAENSYYSFLSKGQMMDDSVIPEETPVADGSGIMLKPGETVVLMLMAEPLTYPDFRVSEVDGVAVAEITLAEPLSISSLTIRAMGTVPREEKQTVMILGIYERGILVDMEEQFLTISPGQVAAEILLNQSILLKPGQNLKVFVEETDRACKAMIPILELPQKQLTTEKKAS